MQIFLLGTFSVGWSAPSFVAITFVDFNVFSYISVKISSN